MLYSRLAVQRVSESTNPKTVGPLPETNPAANTNVSFLQLRCILIGSAEEDRIEPIQVGIVDALVANCHTGESEGSLFS